MFPTKSTEVETLRCFPFRFVCFGFDLLFGFIRMLRFAYRMLSKCVNRAPFSVCTKGNSTVT